MQYMKHGILLFVCLCVWIGNAAMVWQPVHFI
ncbi:hypothetical protein BamIOP4010DRAFT_4106 [Burkholderia ambifaria IOP40-10]|uniref:Uncharacterized protein n=1 Tax=Burkholderia ambifaria IOP40-10 TaxID=396596 RepID=B1FJ95_9BURK|nr:hypothetical protein BamIOP4010DRAFT_4106 [Burkholderia ambifaria IOP40-10]